jgi:hypothetical protein
MAAPGQAQITINVEVDNLRKVIADAIEENMALPVCEREHVEPMAQWERDLLDAVAVPRVVKDREEFRVGQLVALKRPAALARVAEISGPRVLLDGLYFSGEEGTTRISSPYDYEIAGGLWLILANAQQWAEL